MLPLDTIWKSRRMYGGEYQHQVSFEQQHRLFMLGHKDMKAAKQKQTIHTDNGSKLVELEVGEPA